MGDGYLEGGKDRLPASSDLAEEVKGWSAKEKEGCEWPQVQGGQGVEELPSSSGD